MFNITKKFEFEACHKLYLTYDSPCRNFHGHSYKVELTVFSNELDENGMVMDFSKLNTVKEWVMEHWDHSAIIPKSLIDDDAHKQFGKIFEFPFSNVTAEYMCKLLHQKTCELLKLEGSEVVITIYETTNNCVTYSE